MAVLTRDIRPDVSDVGALLRARTRDEDGNELGTFTPETRPTAAEVDALIEQGQSDVVAGFPDDVSNDLAGQVQSLMALRTAMRIELAYFPEQVATGRSAYEQYRELFNDSLRTLAAAVQRNEPGGPTRIHSLPLRVPEVPPPLSPPIN